MDHIAVGAQSADLEAMLVDGVQKFLALGIVLQQFFRVAVSLAGMSAAADLHHLNTVGCQERAGLVQRAVGQQYSKYT